MNNYLPSKQFVKIIGLSALVGALVFFAGKVFSNENIWERKENSKTSMAENKNDDFFSLDSDGDGLYDWEEALWGTDPYNPDTFGNGLGDKQEIENKRKSMDIDDSYKPDEKNNTELFAKQLYTTASILNQSSAFDQGQIENFSRGIENSFQTFSIQNKYSTSDLKLTGISPETYAKNFINLYNSLFAEDISELYVIAQIIEDPENGEYISRLNNVIILYEKFKDGLLGMQVPYNVAGQHLAIINSLVKVSAIVSESRNINNDPLKVATYLSKYDQYSSEMENSFSAIILYFEQNNLF